MMIATFRMAVQGWPVTTALKEATNSGLHHKKQIEFVEQFAAELVAGNVPGYPP